MTARAAHHTATHHATTHHATTHHAATHHATTHHAAAITGEALVHVFRVMVIMVMIFHIPDAIFAVADLDHLRPVATPPLRRVFTRVISQRRHHREGQYQGADGHRCHHPIFLVHYSLSSLPLSPECPTSTTIRLAVVCEEIMKTR